MDASGAKRETQAHVSLEVPTLEVGLGLNGSGLDDGPRIFFQLLHRFLNVGPVEGC